jgi:4-nitrophenyl phosphatase
MMTGHSSFDFRLYRGFIFDVDGVLFRGETMIDRANETVHALKAQGKKVFCLSNNSRHDRFQYAEKFRAFPLAPEELFHAARGAAAYIASRHPRARVAFLGSAGLQTELALHGLIPVEVTRHSPPVDFLVVGHDPEFNYAKLTGAVRILRQGARLVAVNMDRVFPQEEGDIPGPGGVVKALEYYSNMEAILIGKPNPTLAQLALQKMGITATEGVMIGDSLHLDITCGKAAGMTTVLVLTGEACLADVQRHPYQPDFVLPDITALLPYATKEEHC